MIRKIISGAQTGADRGALEAAELLGIERGGFVPAGWRAEDGVIPERYRPGLTACSSRSYRVRTLANIEASDGTLVLSFGNLTPDSGSMLTARVARKIGRPLLHLTIEKLDNPIGAAMARGWLIGRGVSVLNVAGPRESVEPGLQAAVRSGLIELLSGHA